MIINNDTCFSVLLDHEDINGCVDIAKFGVEAMVKHKLSRDLLQSMAEFIVQYATGRVITFDPDQGAIEDDTPIEGQALMTIQRLICLEQANKHRK